MKPKPGQAGAVVVVRRSIASDNARNQFDHDVGHTFAVPELVRRLHLLSISILNFS